MGGSPNKKKTPRKERERHLNFMGGAGYFVSDPIMALRIAASSCFFGEPRYYMRDSEKEIRKHRGPTWARQRPLSAREVEYLRNKLNAVDPQVWRTQAPAQALEAAIDRALDHDPEATLQEALRLRVEEHIRTTPQVILVRAANHPKVRGTGLIRTFAPDITLRADEPAVQLAYQRATYPGQPIPNSLKKAWARDLRRRTEYELAKYRLEGREVKLVDVVNLAHPVVTPAIDKLVKGKLRQSEHRTWEAIISEKGSNRKAWEEAVEVMGHMALLRNLRNLLQAGVPLGRFANKLVAGARKGKQLPFRYYSAYQAVGPQAGAIRDVIETCMEVALENVPQFPGRLMSLCDNSGSAQNMTTSQLGTMRISTIANLTGIVAGSRADEGHVGVFGDKLQPFAVRHKSSIFDQLDKAELLSGRDHGATEHGIWLFWDQAIRNKEHWDHVFVFSDMQAGHGGLYGINPSLYHEYLWPGSDRYIDVAKLVNTYRAKVNPAVNVYLVQVAGYEDTILPEFYERTFILGGWGEGLLRFAAEMSGLFNRGQQAA